jgi:hypothetical protein
MPIEHESRARHHPEASRPARTSVVPAVLGSLALIAVGLAWSLASPIGASPDDDFHLATIWCDAGDLDLCRRTGEQVEEGVERVRVIAELGPGIACFAFRPEVSAGCQAALEQEAGTVSGRADDGLYPGGFHRFMSLFASSRIGRSVLVMRMVSWLLAVSLLVAACVLAGPDLRRAFSLAALTTLVPLGVFLFASNNPSGLAVAGVAAYWCAAYAYMSGSREDRRRFAAVVVVLVLGAAVALASRHDTGLYLGVASAAAWVSTGGYQPSLRRRSLLLFGLSAVGAAATLTGTQSQRAVGGAPDADRSLGLVLFENALELPRLVLGSLGTFGLGWLDTPLPGLTSVFMLLAFGGVVVTGLSVPSREKWLAMAVVAGAVVVIPTIVLALDRYLVGEQVQPRYLLPLLPVLVGTALVAPRGRAGVVLRRGQVLLVAAAVVLAHAAALHANIRRYVTGVDTRGFDLGAQVEWWWGTGPGPLATWALGSAAFAVAVACVLLLVGRPSSVRAPAVAPQARISAGAP